MSIACLPSDWWRKLRVGTRGWAVLRCAGAVICSLTAAGLAQAQMVQESIAPPVPVYAPVIREAMPTALPGTVPIVREAIPPFLPTSAGQAGQVRSPPYAAVGPSPSQVPLPPLPGS